MAWLESHQSLGSHVKTKRAARILGISRVQVIGHLHYLWWWALDHAEDGDLSRFDAEEIAEEACWEGEPQVFVAALQECGRDDEPGFLDADMRIHDWDVYTLRFRKQRDSNRERQRRHREKLRNAAESPTDDADPVTEALGNGAVTVTSPLPNTATVPNLTQPDMTEPGTGDAARLSGAILRPAFPEHKAASWEEDVGEAPDTDGDPGPCSPLGVVTVYCDAIGTTLDALKAIPGEKAKSFGQAAKLLEWGYPADVVGDCLIWLLSDDWHSSRGVDLGTVQKHIKRWDLNGRPAAMEPGGARGRDRPREAESPNAYLRDVPEFGLPVRAVS